jgi:hypothetical protein
MGHRQVVELLDHAGSRRHPMLDKLSQQVLTPRPSTVSGFQHHTAVVLGTIHRYALGSSPSQIGAQLLEEAAELCLLVEGGDDLMPTLAM